MDPYAGLPYKMHLTCLPLSAQPRFSPHLALLLVVLFGKQW